MNKFKFLAIIVLAIAFTPLDIFACTLAPTNLQYTQSGSTVQLSWDASPGASSYIVELIDPAYSTAFNPSEVWADTTANNYYNMEFSFQAYPVLWRLRAICSGGEAASDSLLITTVCSVATGVQTSNIDYTQATISWSLISYPTEDYFWSVGYRVLGTSTWTQVNFGNTTTSNQTSTVLTNLQPGTTYEWCVNQWCPLNGVLSDPVISQFTTLTPSCSIPSGLSNTGIGSGGASVSWSAVLNADYYTIQWFINNSPTLSGSAVITSNTYQFTNLSPGTSVLYRVSAHCPYFVGSEYNFSAYSSFTTSAPPAVSSIYIDYFKLANIERASGAEPGGYVNTGINGIVTAGQEYQMKFSTGSTGVYTKQNYAIYLDMNGNGVLENSERLFGVGAAFNKNILTIKVKIPSSTSLGNAKLRVIMMPGSGMSPNPTLSPGVEVEDYSVDVVAPANAIKAAVFTSNKAAESVALFPNPSTGLITITTPKTSVVEVFGASGQMVLTQKINPESTSNIDLTTQENGLYFFKILDTDGAIQMHKVLLQK